TECGSWYDSGLATCTCTPSIAAAWTSDVATLLPSPTYAIVRPRSVPSRSRTVRKSAMAWHGCSSSVSAFTTCRRRAEAANSWSTFCENVRMTTPSTHRSRLRATSATGSRHPSATSGCSGTMWPPSSRTAISNVVRVGSDGLSKSSATCRPLSASAVGAWRPSERSAFTCAASARQFSRSAASKSRTERKSFFRATVVGMGISGAIVGVDADVLRTQITRPHRRRYGACAEVDRHGNVLPLQVRRGLRRGFVVRLAVLEQDDRANHHGGALELERHARAAGDGNQASPVRVAAVNRRLHQRRVR